MTDEKEPEITGVCLDIPTLIKRAKAERGSRSCLVFDLNTGELTRRIVRDEDLISGEEACK